MCVVGVLLWVVWCCLGGAHSENCLRSVLYPSTVGKLSALLQELVEAAAPTSFWRGCGGGERRRLVLHGLNGDGHPGRDESF